MFTLPTRTDLPRYSFDIELDDASFKFDFEWNDRDENWYFNLYDVDGNPLLMGRRVCLSSPLIDRFLGSDFPKGALYAIDTTGKDIEPGLADLGDRVKLIYFEEADLG